MEILQALDEGALYWFENHHASWATAVMKGMTFVGEPKVMLALTLGTGISCLLWTTRRTAAIVLLTALLAFLLGDTVKRLVVRPRPDVAWRMIPLPKDKSFPSGHALNSLADFGAVALIACHRLRSRVLRRVVIGLGFGLALLIGLSRPYLGVHYPSDVVGGWTAGLAFALLAYWADLRWGEGREELVAQMISPASGDTHSPCDNSEGAETTGAVTAFKAPT